MAGQVPALDALNGAQKVLTIKGMHPGPTIRKIRRERDMRLEQLATEVERHLGKPVNTGNLSRLERQLQGYSNDLIQAIALALKVDVARLFGGPATLPAQVGTAESDPISVRDRTVSALSIRQVDAPELSRDQLPVTVVIPQMEIEAGMGVGRVEPEYETIIGALPLNETYVRRNFPTVTSPKNIRIITGSGDSMWDQQEKRGFQDGDPIFVDVGITEIRFDAIYVFALNSEIYVKLLQRLPDGTVKVISYNDKYPPYIVTDRENMRVIARVVGGWNWSKL